MPNTTALLNSFRRQRRLHRSAAILILSLTIIAGAVWATVTLHHTARENKTLTQKARSLSLSLDSLKATTDNRVGELNSSLKNITDLVQGQKPPVAYICGKISGIRFQKTE